MQSVGDLAQMHLLRVQQTKLKTNLNNLTQEVSTGLSFDPASSLRGDIKNVLSLNSNLQKIENYRINITEAEVSSNAMQTALTQIFDRSTTLSQNLLTSRLTTSNAQLETIGLEAKNNLEQMLASLNSQIGGNFLFSGTATDREAVVDIDRMMTDLRTAVSGITDSNVLEATIDTWFNSAGGGFETLHYTGSVSNRTSVPLSENTNANIGITANEQPFRELMKSMALVALATDPSTNLNINDTVEAITTASVNLIAAQEQLVVLQAELGQKQNKISEAKAEIETERTTSQMAKLEFLGVDQYETAVAYEETRNQLEAIFAITARSQRLSLTGFIQ